MRKQQRAFNAKTATGVVGAGAVGAGARAAVAMGAGAAPATGTAEGEATGAGTGPNHQKPQNWPSLTKSQKRNWLKRYKPK
jgi:hypothetical protein